MAIEIPTLEELTSQILGYERVRFPSADLSPESFLGKKARAEAMFLLGLYRSVEDADFDGIPQSKTSRAALVQWADRLGLSNGEGGYGALVAIQATGGVATIDAGTAGATLPAGSTALAEDGVTVIVTDEAVTLDGNGDGTVDVSADTAGVAGNLDEDAVITWVSPPAGIPTSATISTELSGGDDEESTANLLQRVLTRLQTPPKGGHANDYRTWNESIAGVKRAYVYPHRGGLGTVHAVLTQNGSGTTRAIGTTTKATADTYLATVRPVTVQGYTSFAPSMAAGNGKEIRVRVVPAKDEFDFDWDDGGTPMTVKAGGTTSLLRINGSPPANLTSAVSAGDEPRIQIANSTTGAPVICEQPRVTAIDIVTISPDTILTLDTALTVYPTAANNIYAGGPVVDTIQNDILDYTDILGPSRAGEFADEDDAWEDTIAIYRLAGIALEAVDDDEVTRLCSDITAVTIAGAAANYQPPDNGASAAPSMAYATRILVTI